MRDRNKFGVLTTYKINGHPYSSYVLGESMDEVHTKIEMRGLDESIISVIQEIETIPKITDLSNTDEVLHVCFFLSFIALKAKTMSVEEIIGDEGIIHQLVHIKTASIKLDQAVLNTLLVDIDRLHKSAIGLF